MRVARYAVFASACAEHQVVVVVLRDVPEAEILHLLAVDGEHRAGAYLGAEACDAGRDVSGQRERVGYGVSGHGVDQVRQIALCLSEVFDFTAQPAQLSLKRQTAVRVVEAAEARRHASVDAYGADENVRAVRREVVYSGTFSHGQLVGGQAVQREQRRVEVIDSIEVVDARYLVAARELDEVVYDELTEARDVVSVHRVGEARARQDVVLLHVLVHAVPVDIDIVSESERHAVGRNVPAVLVRRSPDLYHRAVEDAVVLVQVAVFVEQFGKRHGRDLVVELDVAYELDGSDVGRKRAVDPRRKGGDRSDNWRRQLRRVRLECADVRTQALYVGESGDVAVVESELKLFELAGVDA